MSQEPPLVLFTPKSRRIIAFAALQEQYQVLERFGGRCAYGQRAQATTGDHIIPASRGEQTKLENWVPACNLCNSEKRDQEVLAWMRSRAVHMSSALLEAIVRAYQARPQIEKAGGEG